MKGEIRSEVILLVMHLLNIFMWLVGTKGKDCKGMFNGYSDVKTLYFRNAAILTN